MIFFVYKFHDSIKFPVCPSFSPYGAAALYRNHLPNAYLVQPQFRAWLIFLSKQAQKIRGSLRW